MTSFWESGIKLNTIIILVANFKVKILCYCGFPYLLNLVTSLSIIMYFAFLLMLNSWFLFPFLTENMYYGLFWRIFLNINTYLEVFIIVALTSLLDLGH